VRPEAGARGVEHGLPGVGPAGAGAAAEARLAGHRASVSG
jgi:hypothetical protein